MEIEIYIFKKHLDVFRVKFDVLYSVKAIRINAAI